MSTGIDAFDSTIQITNNWLHDLKERLAWQDSQKTYHAMRAVLHALRDRLPVENAASFSSQLPCWCAGFTMKATIPAANP